MGQVAGKERKGRGEKEREKGSVRKAR